MSFIQFLGWTGNAAFFSRFVVQWIVSEKAGRSVAPRSFWWLSLLGAVCFTAYLSLRGEVVLMTGVCVNGCIYVRNLFLSYGESRSRLSTPVLVASAIAATLVLIVSGTGRMGAAWDDTPLWFLCSIAGQASWSSRFVVQWFSSERRGSSYFPRIFWWISLFGNAFLMAYAVHLGDPVLIAGFLTGPLVQIRNLVLSGRAGQLTPCVATKPDRTGGSDSAGGAVLSTPHAGVRGRKRALRSSQDPHGDTSGSGNPPATAVPRAPTQRESGVANERVG